MLTATLYVDFGDLLPTFDPDRVGLGDLRT